MQVYYSYLINCWLPNANLENVDFKWANLEGSYLVGADLKYAELVATNFTSANLVNANFLLSNHPLKRSLENNDYNFSGTLSNKLKFSIVPDVAIFNFFNFNIKLAAIIGS